MDAYEPTPPRPLPDVARDHRRQWRDLLYVYPVISRRARGLSVGVNLNPDKRCTFGCLYCQINRRVRRDPYGVRLEVLRTEIELVLEEAKSGRIWEHERFAATPPEMRRINDIAFSGDGEPTCLEAFDAAVQMAADVKDKLALGEVKIVVITNAAHLDEPQVERALPILDAHGGEIWAKLDAGTEEHFRTINRPGKGVTLERVVGNIARVSRDRPVVIQSLFLVLDGEPPGEPEVQAYCERLREILDAGGRIKLVQVHTIARAPASARVASLPDEQLDAVAAAVRNSVPDVPVEVYYGADVPPQ